MDLGTSPDELAGDQAAMSSLKEVVPVTNAPNDLVIADKAGYALNDRFIQHRMNLISGNDQTSRRLPAFGLFVPGSRPNTLDHRKSIEERGIMRSSARQ